jgi:hypothetical protein
MMKDDFTPTGIKLLGAWENDRNSENSALFKDIIRECFGVHDVICGHHLVYQIEDKRPDGFTYQVVEEIPSADALIFDHDVAKKLWGITWQSVLTMLVLEPAERRDALLAKLYYERKR